LGSIKKLKIRPQYSLYRGTKNIQTIQLLFQQRKGKTLIKLQYGMHKFLGKWEHSSSTTFASLIRAEKETGLQPLESICLEI
jgi:hypothetical protein